MLTPQQALEKCNGNKTAAANYPGISRTTFWRRRKLACPMQCERFIRHKFQYDHR
ncbi:helix-turn-helix domain-containing protein [Escherichia coli]